MRTPYKVEFRVEVTPGTANAKSGIDDASAVKDAVLHGSAGSPQELPATTPISLEVALPASAAPADRSHLFLNRWRTIISQSVFKQHVVAAVGSQRLFDVFGQRPFISF